MPCVGGAIICIEIAANHQVIFKIFIPIGGFHELFLNFLEKKLEP